MAFNESGAGAAEGGSISRQTTADGGLQSSTTATGVISTSISGLAKPVTVTSVLRVPKSEVWKLRWTEAERPLQGGSTPRTRAWEGYVTVRIVAPRNPDAIEANPLGLHIASLTWTEITEAAELSSHGGGTP